MDAPVSASDGCYFVYMVQCNDGTLYSGVTTDLERRVQEHNESPKGAKYTRARRPVVLVYSEMFKSRSEAQMREAELKKLPRAQKQILLGEKMVNS